MELILHGVGLSWTVILQFTLSWHAFACVCLFTSKYIVSAQCLLASRTIANVDTNVC